MTTLEGPRPEPMTPQELGKRSYDVIKLFKLVVGANQNFKNTLALGFWDSEHDTNIYLQEDRLTSSTTFNQGDFTYEIKYSQKPTTDEVYVFTQDLEVKKYHRENFIDGFIGSASLSSTYYEGVEDPEFRDGSADVQESGNFEENTLEAYDRIHVLLDEIFPKPAGL